jgi:predicted outer membrane repeat protein
MEIIFTRGTGMVKKKLLPFLFIAIFLITNCQSVSTPNLGPTPQTSQSGTIPSESTKQPTATDKIPTASPSPTATPYLRPTSTPIHQPNPVEIFTICQLGCDFATIQSALDSEVVPANSLLKIIETIHTEKGILVYKNVIIEGSSPEDSIIQAAATVDDANERLFDIQEGVHVWIRNVTLQNGHSFEEPFSSGGAIKNFGSLTIENCWIQNNIGGDSGAVLNEGTLIIINSIIRDNIAFGNSPWGNNCGSGGAFGNASDGKLYILNSAILNNYATGKGGAMHLACNSEAWIYNTTISGNQAEKYGGAIHLKGILTLENSTIADNSAKKETGGLYNYGFLNISNSILANNQSGIASPDDCTLNQYRDDQVDRIGINQNNIILHGNCEGGSTQDPLLLPLAASSSTFSHALSPDSPAIDQIDLNQCPLNADQNGTPRPTGEKCDIGSVEFVP